MDSGTADAFRALPYGIYALTTGRGTDVSAMIVSWVSQVSYDPPLLLVAVRRNRPALSKILDNGFFSLSLLKPEQVSFVAGVKRSSGPPALPFLDSGEDGAPFLKDALACFACRIVSSTRTGDHFSIIGEVLCTLRNRGERALTTSDYGKTYIGQS